MSDMPFGSQALDPPVPILVVDDEEVLRDLITQTLYEFSITTANDGQEAIEKLSRNNYELIITDLMMPRVDGFAILEAVRKKKCRTDVLVLTGYPSAENERRCRDLGCWDVIAKPFEIIGLRDEVNRWCKDYRRRMGIDQRDSLNTTTPPDSEDSAP